MNKVLNIPIVTQKSDYDCSVASLSMILKFHGESVPYEELLEGVKDLVNPEQRHVEAIAIYLADKGYKVHFSNFNKSVLSENLINKTEQNLRDFEEYLKTLTESNNSFKKTKLELAIKLIKKGVKYDTHQMDIDKICNLVENGIPVILCVKASILRNNPDYNSNHYIIISGIENENFIISDSSKQFTNPYKLDFKTIEEAWKATGYYTLWVEK